MKERRMTCIVCPLGCELTVSQESAGAPLTVRGNTCPRGAAYAEGECTDPRRTVTTTVIAEGGEPVSVRTETPIPKDLVMEAVRRIGSVRPPLPIRIGDVIIEDVCGSRVIATQNKMK